VGDVCLNSVKKQLIGGKNEEVFTLGQMAQCVPKTVISAAPHILWQKILDTQENVSYTADN